MLYIKSDSLQIQHDKQKELIKKIKLKKSLGNLKKNIIRNILIITRQAIKLGIILNLKKKENILIQYR